MKEVVFTDDFTRTLQEIVSENQAIHKVLVLSDQTVASFYLETVVNTLKPTVENVVTFIVPDGESSKSLVQYEEIVTYLATNNFGRGDLLISLGGGVIGDLGGFVASTYKRGIKIIQLPTSFTAQVDSSVGAKTALNLGNHKNVLGTFYKPLTTIIDGNFLDTLSERNLLEGYVESIKMSLLAGGKFAELTAEIKSPEQILVNREDLIRLSINYKQSVVAADFRDNGIRKFLNFGHTIGHAVELSDNELMHGEAVGIGMVQLAKRLMTPIVVNAIISRLEPLGLPTDSTLIGSEVFFENLLNDKKIDGHLIDLVILDAVGKPSIRTVPLTFFQKITIKKY